MKKILSLAIVLLILLTTLCCFSCKDRVRKPNPKKTINLENMTLVFEDQFDQDKIDDTTWSSWFDFTDRRGGFWHKDQCFTENGNLIIRTEYKEDGEYGSGWYTGMIRTRNLKEFTYGYFEIKCKVPPAEGVWSAFWMQNDNMLGENTNNGKTGAEIDIMESPYYNDPKKPAKKFRNTTLHTVHYDGYGEDYKCVVSDAYEVQKNMYEEFNTYGLLWTKDKYTFYINGEETWSTKSGVSQAPEYLWLSCEVAGKMFSGGDPTNPDNINAFSGEITNNDPSIFPVDFVVDYVRVYQYK